MSRADIRLTSFSFLVLKVEWRGNYGDHYRVFKEIINYAGIMTVNQTLNPQIVLASMTVNDSPTTLNSEP